MCGRYRRTTSEEEIPRHYQIPIPPQIDLPISYNIAPTENVLAIRRNPKTGERTLDAFSLGFDTELGERRKDRVQDNQRPGRNRRYRTVLPAGLQETQVPDSSGWILPY